MNGNGRLGKIKESRENSKGTQTRPQETRDPLEKPNKPNQNIRQELRGEG